MARLNELPMSSDSFETLRKKMLRQNRDLAKSNNVRALRIRELESECALMLSENLELRSRILELEKQVEDNEARRIADHALSIKAKLEAQLTEWGTLLSGLGLEPPMKRHSPHIRKNIKQRMNFNSSRPSPSQRRLRDVAREIEELGHISENRASSRQSLNPEQIHALLSESESVELSTPSKAPSIEQEPVKVDSPLQPAITKPQKTIAPPVTLVSPQANKTVLVPVSSPEKKKKEHVSRAQKVAAPPVTLTQGPVTVHSMKTGSKRKYAQEEPETVTSRNENAPPRLMTDKMSIRDKADGKTLKELAHMRKESRAKEVSSGSARKPLSAKSTNEDFSLPKKTSRPISTAIDEVAIAKAELAKTRPTKEKTKTKTKNDTASKGGSLPVVEIAPPSIVATTKDLANPIAEPALMSPNSPEPTSQGDKHRGDTPPPADISSNGETSRPSRRNRTAVSYAEPNLRDKMRRPTKELFDAVTGEGKYARRASQCDHPLSEGPKMKRDSTAGDLMRGTLAANDVSNGPEPGSIPASPLAKKSSIPECHTATISTERRRRTSRVVDYAADLSTDGEDDEVDTDVYEFADSSPYADKDESTETRPTRRQGPTARRRSAAVDSVKAHTAKERGSSRRRSMMV